MYPFSCNDFKYLSAVLFVLLILIDIFSAVKVGLFKINSIICLSILLRFTSTFTPTFTPTFSKKFHISNFKNIKVYMTLAFVFSADTLHVPVDYKKTSPRNDAKIFKYQAK